MFNFTKGGVQDGTIQPSAPQAAAQPPRPPGIPEHYVFDNEVELWMPPSAISKAAAVAPVSSGSGSEITVIKSSTATPSPYAANSNDPICFEYTNTGVCGRLARGEICRYRHLEATHPDVIADRVRQGKLPASALTAATAGNTDLLKQIMAGGGGGAAPGAPPVAPGEVDPATGLVDPGPGVQLCFDYVNNGSCARLRSGQGCKYRHLPQNHPDVIADRVRQGKLNPAAAAALLSQNGGANPATLQSMLGQPQPAAPMGMPGAATPDPGMMPDPGPGHQLCFDYINKGTCSRISRGEICRYRHLPPNHPEVIADKIKQGKAPGAMPTPPMGNFVENLARLGSQMHGAQAAPPSSRRRSSLDSDSDDSGGRFRARDRERHDRRDDRRDHRDRRDYRDRRDDYRRRDDSRERFRGDFRRDRRDDYRRDRRDLDRGDFYHARRRDSRSPRRRGSRSPRRRMSRSPRRSSRSPRRSSRSPRRSSRSPRRDDSRGRRDGRGDERREGWGAGDGRRGSPGRSPPRSPRDPAAAREGEGANGEGGRSPEEGEERSATGGML